MPETMTRPWSREALEQGGFSGFVPFAALDETQLPEAPGVYTVVRAKADGPSFSEASPARCRQRQGRGRPRRAARAEVGR